MCVYVYKYINFGVGVGPNYKEKNREEELIYLLKWIKNIQKLGKKRGHLDSPPK